MQHTKKPPEELVSPGSSIKLYRLLMCYTHALFNPFLYHVSFNSYTLSASILLCISSAFLQFFCFHDFFFRHVHSRLHSLLCQDRFLNVSYPNFILTSKSAFHNLLFYPQCHLVVVSLFSIYPISLPVGRAKGFSYTAVLPR